MVPMAALILVHLELAIVVRAYWCVFIIAVKLIFPASMCDFRIGVTLMVPLRPCSQFSKCDTYSSGCAGSIMTASFELSSTTR